MSVIPGRGINQSRHASEPTGFAGVNGSSGLEGTFLGPALLTGRVAGQTLVAPEPRAVSPRAAHQEFTAADAESCGLCHALPRLLAQPRAGYAHFDRVAQTGNCVHCHLADERP